MKIDEMKIDETTIQEVMRYLNAARFPWETELKKNQAQLRQFFANRSLGIIPSRFSFISQFLSQLRSLKLKKLEGKIIHLKQKVNFFDRAETELKAGRSELASDILRELASSCLHSAYMHDHDFMYAMPSQDFYMLQKLQVKLKNAA